jgi:hypothetical protein
MMKIRRIALACLATALPLVCAAADEVRHDFECDTPAGHFSYWKRSVSGSEIEISGKVTVNELRKDKKWSPAANVFVARRGDDRTSQYGLRLYAIMKTPDLVFLELLKVGGRDMIGLGPIPRTDKPVPFSLKLDAAGTLTVTVAGSEASTNVGTFKPNSVELSCSTGDFEFTNVVVTEK